MGRKFIDKKKSATFQLMPRDSSDPNYGEGPSGDRVFVRVDNGSYSIPGFGDDGDDDAEHSGDTHLIDDPNSIFADAPEDGDEYEHGMYERTMQAPSMARGPLPDNVRREILELGFPDDGYNYLLHLREIKNNGSGSAYYENSKAKLDQLSHDVKAYDASRVSVPVVSDDLKDNTIYSIAAKTVGVRVQKVVDPDIAALLDDGDLSRFGSDVEDLDEDFVVQANLPEEGDVVADNKNVVEDRHHPTAVDEYFLGENESRSCQLEVDSGHVNEKPRVHRLLDEQFDLLTLQEYGLESDGEYDGSIGSEDECLALKLSNALKDHHVKDELKLDDKYKVPADLVHENQDSNNDEALESATVIRRCAEYGQMYENENQNNDDVVIMEESSDESEMWDCESIVTTYSNLENHPVKIETPGRPRRKKLPITASTLPGVGSQVIALGGKEKLPLDYLPYNKKAVPDKASKAPGSKSSEHTRKPRDGESKEEKKERKAAVKEERREARKAKKELKAIYRCEGQHAQKVAAFTGPSAIHLM